MPRNTVAGALAPASAPDTVSPAVVWARAYGAAEIPEVATTQSLTTTVVSYLRWILDRAAMMFQIPAGPGAAGRWTGR